MTPEEHRRLGVDLNKHVWALLEQERRTPEEDEEMLHAAHASHYHWARVGGPEHLSRGNWMCSHVYAVLGRSEPALWHAQRALELCEEHGIGDFDLAYAYEALMRAHRVGGDPREAESYARLAEEQGKRIADAEDAEIFWNDFARPKNLRSGSR